MTTTASSTILASAQRHRPKPWVQAYLTETTTGAIHDTLTEARHRLGGPALGMVLTLIIVTDESAQYDAVRAASQAGREHPCRVLGVIARNPLGQVPARCRDPARRERARRDPAAAHARPARPARRLRGGPAGAARHPGRHLVAGSGARHPLSADPLGALAQRRVTDAAASDKPRQMLTALASGYRPGDTDLSWTRATPWRSLLAATLDQPYGELLGGTVSAEERNPSADLVATWLAGRLGIPVRREVSAGPGITEVNFATPDGDITAVPAGRPHRHAEQARPARPAGRAEPPGHRRAARRGTAQARSRRGVRRGPRQVRRSPG